MDLSGSWEYVVRTARSRLSNNLTPHHRYELGESGEILGVAGEIVARNFFGMPGNVHEGFDNGVDIKWGGMTIDVKATILTPNLAYRFLQWPEWKRIKAEIILLTAVDPITQLGVAVGYATKKEIESAPVNRTRAQPCREIPVTQLHGLWELYASLQGGSKRRSQIPVFTVR